MHLTGSEKLTLKGKGIINYFKNHQHAAAMFRANSKLEWLKVAMTRFASYYIMLKRLVDVREALATTVVLNLWKEWMKHGDEKGKQMAALVTEQIGRVLECFHSIICVTKPIYKLIRFCDKDGPLMGEVYEGMYNMLGEIKDNLRTIHLDDYYPQIEGMVLQRWEKMNIPMHCLGFALSPKFYDSNYLNTPAPGGVRKRPNEDKEVVANVLKAFEKIADDNEARLLRKHFADFHMHKGLFSTAAASVGCVTMDAIDWWGTYGSETTQLVEVARKILSQPITISSADRAWSTYSFIHNMKRNRLNSSRVDKLVFIHLNIQLLSRFQDSCKQGPFKKWDVDPEDTTVDESHVRLEELRWQSLEDEE